MNSHRNATITKNMESDNLPDWCEIPEFGAKDVKDLENLSFDEYKEKLINAVTMYSAN